MSVVIEVDPARPEELAGAIESAASALASGGMVVLPTETVYGIACRPDAPGATERLFRAKRRPGGLNLPVLAASARVAWQLAWATPAARRLADRFWPGPLTMILNRTEASEGWWLGEHHRTIAVRVPDHPVALALLGRTGPLAATSANVSGMPPLAGRAGLTGVFGRAVAVYLLTPEDARGGAEASTVVDLTAEEPRVLRHGTVSEASIRAEVGGATPRAGGSSGGSPGPAHSLH